MLVIVLTLIGFCLAPEPVHAPCLKAGWTLQQCEEAMVLKCGPGDIMMPPRYPKRGVR